MKRIPKTHRAKDLFAILRHNLPEDWYWLDSSTIAVTPLIAKRMARELEDEMPRFYVDHPAAGLYELSISAKLMEKL